MAEKRQWREGAISHVLPTPAGVGGGAANADTQHAGVEGRSPAIYSRPFPAREREK